MSKLPKGISQRGNKYKWEVMKNGRRFAGYCDTVEEAVSARADAASHTNVIGLDTCGRIAERLLETDWSEENCKSHDWFARNSGIICDFFGADTPIEKVTQERVTDFIIYLREKKRNSNGTINRKLAALSKMLNYAREAGFIQARPLTKRQKEPVGRIRFLSEEEEKELIKYCMDNGYIQVANAIIVLIDTGMRTGELEKLTRDCIDFDKRIVILKDTKNGENRSVPLTKRAVNALVRLLDMSEDNIHVVPQKTDWLRYVWNSAKNDLGHSDDEFYVPHILRHTCASRLVQKGAPLYTVAAWLGHKSITTTRRYAHLRPDDVLSLVHLLDKEDETPSKSDSK